MSLFDDTTTRTEGTETQPNTPETATPAPTPAAASPETPAAASAEAPAAPRTTNKEMTTTTTEDFATALENYTNETEAAAATDDHVIKGIVVNITETHVVVDIGKKSEGMVPIAEVKDHEGNVPFKAGDEISVMVERGETEEGYTKLS